METYSSPSQKKKRNPMIKGPRQIYSILKAAAMGDACFRHMLGFLRTGMTEEEAAGEVERYLRSLGSEGLAFPTICVSGERTVLPHGEPTDKKLERGDLVTLDFGAVADGYCSDMTRTVAMGSVTEEQRKVYGLVLEAQTAALDGIRAGVACREIDRIARDKITEAGYGEYFVHGTGHGVGRKVHEPPTLNGKSEETLEEGMPVTVEPGIYIPGAFGVRIEDLAIVTKFGIINIVNSPKELIIL